MAANAHCKLIAPHVVKTCSPDAYDSIVAASFNLEVTRWGLAHTGPLSVQYRPFVWVKATLQNDGGEVLWQGWGFSSPQENVMASRKFDEYLTDPEFFRSNLAIASEVATKRALAQLK